MTERYAHPVELFHDAWSELNMHVFHAYSEWKQEGGQSVPRYMIQLPHEGNRTACIRAIQAIQKHGSHLITHMDWGCKAGVHTGWAVVEADNLQLATMMVPSECRRDATITELNRFTTEEMASWTDHSEG